jgi:hypothetical protein
MCFGVASFFIGSLYFFEPLALLGCLFSSEVFLFEPLAFWGYLFFHRMSLFLSPLCFGVASFFVGGLYFFDPMSEGCNNALSFMALAFLVYQVSSNTELALLAISTIVITFLGNEAYIIALPH